MTKKITVQCFMSDSDEDLSFELDCPDDCTMSKLYTDATNYILKNYVEDFEKDIVRIYRGHIRSSKKGIT